VDEKEGETREQVTKCINTVSLEDLDHFLFFFFLFNLKR
jgi:hypothetical protein